MLLFKIPRFFFYLAIVIVVLLGIVVIGLRYWLLPNISDYKQQITENISDHIGMPTTIGHITADWTGLNPYIGLDDVRFFGNDKKPALQFAKVETTISWRSILTASVQVRSLKIKQLSLEVRRDKAGKISVAGIEIERKEGEGGFSDLLLGTRSIFIQNASLIWRDELRNAPALPLEKVSLHIENRGSRHRFGLVATPPKHLAATIDIKGDLRGKRLSELAHWSGSGYISLPRAEGSAWRHYYTLPETFKNGSGTVRLWIEFSKKHIDSLIAELHLSNTEIRLREDLSILDLASVNGRLRYRSWDKGFEVISENLALVPKGQTKTGPTNFFFHFEPSTDKKLAEGLFKANRLQIAAWVSLSHYLPLDKSIKAKMLELAPSGVLTDLSFKWSGEMLAPKKFSLKGSIEKGAIYPAEKYPGLIGLSATIDANETAGNLTVKELDQINWPIGFDVPLTPQQLFLKTSWKRRANFTDVVINEFSYKDAHLAGSVSGTYKFIPQHPGEINIDASFTKLDGQYVAQYLKPVMKPHGYDWLKKAIVSAKGTDTHLKVVGDLHHFPFADEKYGRFIFETQVENGILNFNDAWPSIENINGEIILRGRGLIVKAKSGTIFGARLKDVTAKVDNLFIDYPVLEIIGEASGPVNEKLRFIDQSPVKKTVGNFIEGVTAGGRGKLKLKLVIPFHDPTHSIINGDYEFQKASLKFNSGMPSIDNVTGHLLFSEKDVQAKNLNAQILGGPALINVTSLPENGVSVKAAGSVETAQLINHINHPSLKHISGKTDWQGKADVHHGRSLINISSSLKGVQIGFPAPFFKVSETIAPLYIEQRSEAGKPDIIRASVEKMVSTEFERSSIADQPNGGWKRGLISIGKPLSSYPAEGLWLQANVDELNVDHWNAFMKPFNSSGNQAVLPLSGAELTARSVNIFNQKFIDVQMIAKGQADKWQADVTSPVVEGKFLWQGGENKTLQVRLKRFHTTESLGKEKAESNFDDNPQDFPSLDVVVDDFQMRNKKFGKLELKMNPKGKNWQIENLHITQPDAVVEANGLWSVENSPSTSLNFKITTSNVGSLLNELNFKNLVKGANADLAGDLTWPGAPYDMSPSKLSGKLKLEARKGQFLKVDPGAGRLLGLINLQSLPRRITLDFRDIFSEGYVFDAIEGDINIQQGIMNTRNFLIIGPAAKVELSGNADLAKETQQLDVKVIPIIGEGVSIASGILGGPLIGLTTYLLQKVLKDPLGRAAAYEYKVSGTWDNPTVVKADGRSRTEVSQ